MRGTRVLRAVDVISGGLPCQDISAVGKRTGMKGFALVLWGNAASCGELAESGGKSKTANRGLL